jgi:hypothetical protein
VRVTSSFSRAFDDEKTKSTKTLRYRTFCLGSQYKKKEQKKTLESQTSLVGRTTRSLFLARSDDDDDDDDEKEREREREREKR